VATNYEELERFESVLDEGGDLCAVLALTWDLPDSNEAASRSNSVAAVELTFETCSCLIQAVGADDTLGVFVRARDDLLGDDPHQRWRDVLIERSVVHNVSSQRPWKDMIGHPLLWAWSMRNHRSPGDDGVQLHIGSEEIQLVTMSSALKLYNMNEMEFAFPGAQRGA